VQALIIRSDCDCRVVLFSQKRLQLFPGVSGRNKVTDRAGSSSGKNMNDKGTRAYAYGFSLP
jgi:hypothetical protein